MRVLHVLDFSPPFAGGIVGHLRALGEALAARGGRLLAAFPRARPWFADLEGPCETLVLPSIRRPLRSGFAPRFERICRAQDVDLAHLHFSFALPLALACRMGRPPVPIVHHWHAPPRALLPSGGRLPRGAAGLLARLADRRSLAAHVAVSAQIRDLLTTHHWTTPERITLLPNALARGRGAIPAGREAGGPAPQLAGGGLVLGSVANFRPQKDHPTLLRAFAGVRRAFPQARLLLVGDGPTRMAMERLAEELGLGGSVEFAGFVEAADDVYDRLDVFVLSSHSEGQGLVLLEAMDHGLPVAATDLPPIRETVGVANAPFLAPPGDAEGLAQAIGRLLRDAALRAERGDANRERARTEFDLSAWCARLLELYDRLAAGR